MVYKHVYVRVCAEAYKDQRSELGVFYHFPSNFFVPEFSLNIELINLAALTGQWGTNICLPLPLSIRNTGTSHHDQLSCIQEQALLSLHFTFLKIWWSFAGINHTDLVRPHSISSAVLFWKYIFFFESEQVVALFYFLF